MYILWCCYLVEFRVSLMKCFAEEVFLNQIFGKIFITRNRIKSSYLIGILKKSSINRWPCKEFLIFKQNVDSIIRILKCFFLIKIK